jgi:hypothetical protein
LKNGLVEAINIRFWALKINLQNTIASQASVFLLPLILIGLWKNKDDRRIFIATIAWLGYIVLMSFVFPYAGARGGFFHSGAALQPMWWALAPLGLLTLVEWVGKKRSWKIAEASKIFLWATTAFALLITVFIVGGKLFDPNSDNIWSYEKDLYRQVDGIIGLNSIGSPIVIVANPPGYYLATGKSAIALPDGDEQTTLMVAKIFNATFLVLEEKGYPNGLNGLYQNPQNYPNFIFLGELEGTRVYKINT